MEEIHAQVKAHGTSPEVFDVVRNVEFLRKCLRQAGLDEDLIGDVADACDLNDLDALSLGCNQLTHQDAADRLFLTQDEARSLLEVCRKQCLRAGVKFGDGAVYASSPDDEWLPEPDPNAPVLLAPPVAAVGSPKTENTELRRRSISARRSSEDGLGLSFTPRKSRTSPSPRPSLDGPTSPNTHHLESMPEEPRPALQPQLTLAQSLSRAESAKSQPENSNGTLASQLAKAQIIRQQQKLEQQQEQLLQEQKRLELQQQRQAAKASSSSRLSTAPGPTSSRQPPRTPATAATPSRPSPASSTHTAAASPTPTNAASRQSRHTPVSATSSATSRPARPTPAVTTNEAQSNRTPVSAFTTPLLSVPRPLGTSFMLDSPLTSGAQTGTSGFRVSNTDEDASRMAAAAAAAAAAARRNSKPPIPSASTTPTAPTPATSTPNSARQGGAFGSSVSRGQSGPAVGASGLPKAASQRTPRPESAPAAPLPSYARPTASTKAAGIARKAEEEGLDVPTATAAALGLHPTTSSSDHTTPQQQYQQQQQQNHQGLGTSMSLPHSASQSRRMSPSKQTPPPGGEGDDSKKKKSIFANISASLLRPTKAFLAWSSGKSNPSGEPAGETKQFKARPMPKYLSSSSMRRSVDLGSMHGPANGGGSGAPNSYARRSQVMRTNPTDTSPAPPTSIQPPWGRGGTSHTTTTDRRRSLPGGPSPSHSPSTQPTPRQAAHLAAPAAAAAAAAALLAAPAPAAAAVPGVMQPVERKEEQQPSDGLTGKVVVSGIPTTPSNMSAGGAGGSSGGADGGRSGIPRPPSIQ